jgi:hypothetical protein
MKKVLVLLFLVFGYYLSSTASTNPSLITKLEGKSVLLTFESKQDQKVQITLLDFRGEVLHKETVNTKKTREKIFNLKNLPAGDYLFELEEKFQIRRKSIRIVEEKVNVIKEDIIYKPFTDFKNETWSLNLLSLENDVTVEIKDTDGVVVYTEKMTAPNSINKLYNLSELPMGNYIINVKIDDHMFREVVVLN